MLEHGGKLQQAISRFGGTDDSWIDLSTGINPHHWPVPIVPGTIWNRLPEEEDGLLNAARAYYGCENMLAVAGSQAAIQALPRLRPFSKVGVLQPSYNEHAHAWQQQGHQVSVLPPEQLLQQASNFDVMILVNPNNPTGHLFSIDTLLELHQILRHKGGWLIVDEAFMDATPQQSIIDHCYQSGLVVLRSLGKFFGLAGARVGFVAAKSSLLQDLAEVLGPWPISNPSRWVAQQALRDTSWQQHTRTALQIQSERLYSLLHHAGLTPSGSCALFHWIKHQDAKSLYEQLGQQAILTRLFKQPNSLRLGLPHTETQWLRLEKLLKHLVQKKPEHANV